MKIRSITLGSATERDPARAIERAGPLLALLADRFTAAGFEVQTTRASLPPLARLVSRAANLAELAGRVNSAATSAEVGYVALGPIRWSDDPALASDLAAALPDTLAANQGLFATIETADQGGVCYAAVAAAANVTRTLAASTEQ